MKTLKVDFRNECELIRNMEKSDAWFRKYHRFINNLTPEYFRLDSSQRVAEIDLELEDLLA